MKTKELILHLEKKKEDLIRNFEENYKSLNNTIELLKKELKEETKTIISETQKIPFIDSDNEFIRGRSIPESIINLLKNKQRFLHNKEITDMLLLKYHNKDKNRFSRQLSGILSKLKKEQKIVSYYEGSSKKNVYWGLLDWLDENNNIKIGFEFFSLV